MNYFNCPHCAKKYDQHELFTQDVELISNPIALEVETLPITCSQCHDFFEVARIVDVSFEVIKSE